MDYFYLFVALVLFICLYELRKNRKSAEKDKKTVLSMLNIADSLTWIITDIEYENKLILRKVKKTFWIKHYRISNIKSRVRKQIAEEKENNFLKSLENVN